MRRVHVIKWNTWNVTLNSRLCPSVYKQQPPVWPDWKRALMSVIGNTCAVTLLPAVEEVVCKDGQNLTVSPVSAAERDNGKWMSADDEVWRGTTTSGVTGHSLQGEPSLELRIPFNHARGKCGEKNNKPVWSEFTLFVSELTRCLWVHWREELSVCKKNRCNNISFLLLVCLSYAESLWNCMLTIYTTHRQHKHLFPDTWLLCLTADVDVTIRMFYYKIIVYFLIF